MSIALANSVDTALDAAIRRYEAANPESRARHRQATEVMPGGNTRTVLHFSPFPLTIQKGEGAVLTDLDGHRYTDFLGEYSAGLYGHSHPVIVEAAQRALAGGFVLGGPNTHEAKLAAEVCRRFPTVERVRFCNSGTEANLYALSAARAITRKPAILVFDGAYHGGVFYYGHGGSAINAPFKTLTAPYNDIEETRDIIRANADRLAAIILEPMLGSGGGIVAEKPFMQMLRREADDAGAFLVLDEVMTSRLAPGGMQAVLDVAPDLTSFGKYLGGGMTFGAFGGRADIMDRFDPGRADGFPHSGTFNNNVVTMAAGLAGLREVFTEEACLALNARGDALKVRLNDIAKGRGVPVQVTGHGSILCLHLHDLPVRRPADFADAVDPEKQTLFHLEMVDRGFYLARRGYMSLSLPLTEADYDAFADAFDDVLGAIGHLI